MDKELRIGSTVAVKTEYGNYSFTVTGVDVVPKHELLPEGSRGIIISFMYKNISYEGGLLINENDFVLTDIDDNVLETVAFPIMHDTRSVLEKGGFCKDKMSYILKSDKNYIKMHYDENCNVSEDFDIILEW